MYELKTLLPEFDIQLPTSMYSMKNQSLSKSRSSEVMNGYHNGLVTVKLSTDIAFAKMKKPTCALDLDVLGEKIQQILKSSNNIGSLLIRQDKVLQQLQELKSQLADIRSTLEVCQKSVQHTTKSTAQVTQNIGLNGGLRQPLHDFVINGHPNFIPYAILALKLAWQNTFKFNVKTFTHSTVTDIGPAAREFEQKLQQENVNSSSTNKPEVNITLIWKNCEDTEMISSSTMYVPIYGEVNIIRYFGRIGPAEYRYEDSSFCNEIDLVLDICYELFRCHTSEGIAVLLRELNRRLAKQQFFGGNKMSVADIGVQSSLKRMPSVKDTDLSSSLITWRKRVELITNI